MTESFVSLNIVNAKTKKLFNKENHPLLFYYNGEDNIEQKLLNDSDFVKYIYEAVGNIDDYTSSVIGYFYFDNTGDEEKYIDKSINVQDLFLLELLSDEYRSFAIFYIFDIFKELYENALHKKYESDISLGISYDDIVDIYNEIQKKFPNKFVKSTVINYIRDELRKRYSLNETNVNFLLNELSIKIPDDTK